LNLSAGNATYTNAVNGTGVANVTTSSSGDAQLTGNWSGFTGTLNLNGSGNFKTRLGTTQANVISSSATININAGTTLYLNQGFTYGASVHLFGAGNSENLGALRIESNGNQTGSVTLHANSFIGNNSAGTISGVIGETGGSFGFTKQGNNTLTLSGNNTFTGTVILNSGTVSVGSDSPGAYNLGGATGNNAITFNGGTLQITGTTMTSLGSHTPTFTAGAAVGFDIANAANAFTVSNNIAIATAGNGILTKLGAGKLTLSGSNTVGNSLIASSGTLEITGTTTVDGGSTVNRGFLTVSGNTALTIATGGSLEIKGTTGTKPNSIVGQNAAGTSTVTVNGGSFTVGGNTGFVLGNNINTATGVLTISSGTATITAGSATLQNVQNYISMGRDNATGIINLDGGTLATGRQFIRDGSTGGTAGAGSATFNFNGGVLQAQADQTSGNGWFETATTGTFQVVTTTVKAGGAKIDTNGFTTNINTVLVHDSSLGGTADGGLTKSGTGTLSLGGANTYTGDTTVADGVLLLTNTSGSGTGLGDLSVGASGTVAGTGQIAPNGTAGFAISGNVSPGGLPSAIGTLTFDLGATTGTGTILNGAELRFDLGTANPSLASISAGSSDTLSLAGAAAGDLAFNATSVNFLGTGSAGYYKLFDTSFDATTWSGLSFDGTTGLVTTGLSGFNLTPGLFAEFIVGTATNGAESVGDIYVHVVPEPGSSLTLLAAASVLGLTHRRQRRCCSGS
jgi:autotransporter-associated beta strand protein